MAVIEITENIALAYLLSIAGLVIKVNTDLGIGADCKLAVFECWWAHDFGVIG